MQQVSSRWRIAFTESRWLGWKIDWRFTSLGSPSIPRGSMSIDVPCPACGAQLKAPESKAGKKARCGKCGEKFRIPGTGDSPNPSRRAGEVEESRRVARRIESRPPLPAPRGPAKRLAARGYALQRDGQVHSGEGRRATHTTRRDPVAR